MDPTQLLSLVEAAQSSRHLRELDIAVRDRRFPHTLSRLPFAAYSEPWQASDAEPV